jgi:hypothetical protein
MNVSYCLVLIPFLFACGQPHGEKKNDAKLDRHADYNEPDKEVSESTKPKILPLKSGMTEAEIAGSFFVASENLEKLIGTIEEPITDSPIAVPATTAFGNLKGVFRLNDSIKLIPFYFSDDFGIQAFTKWRISTSDSTLTFVGSLKPGLYEKYSFAQIKEKVKVKNKEFFIGETMGGDEGEVNLYLWTAKCERNDDFRRVVQFEASYVEYENPKSLTYKLTGSQLSIFLNTDSIVSRPNNTIEKIKIKSEIVKTVNLN